MLGVGLGGFVDGIVLHQILQWHHMVSHVNNYPTTTVAGLEANTLADGFFHVAAWILVLAASITMLRAWRAGRFAPSWSFQFGLVLAGWGVFNVVEGLINHQLLGIHHLRDDIGAPLSWDIAFLVLSGLLIIIGSLLHRHAAGRMRRRQNTERPATQSASDRTRDGRHGRVAVPGGRHGRGRRATGR